MQFKTRRIVEAQSSLALVKNGKTEPLTLGDDANISVRVDPAPSVDAPLVFVGYGLNIPERNINDFAGVNLKGAIVVYISCDAEVAARPAAGALRLGRRALEDVQAAGAIGTISIANPKSMDIPWARSTLARLQPAMSLADATLDDAPGQQLSITMNPAHADKLFAGSGHTFAELLALVDAGKPVPSFALPARLKATTRVERSDVESQNVAGILRGADPKRRDEYVVVSAHLDHLGIGGRSTATASTTARWTTRPASRRSSRSRRRCTSRARSRRARFCSSRSPAKRRACSDRATSRRIPRSRARASSPT